MPSDELLQAREVVRGLLPKDKEHALQLLLDLLEQKHNGGLEHNVNDDWDVWHDEEARLLEYIRPSRLSTRREQLYPDEYFLMGFGRHVEELTKRVTALESGHHEKELNDASTR